MREFKLWQEECREEWTLVSPTKRRMQLGLNALKKPRPKSELSPYIQSAKDFLSLLPLIMLLARGIHVEIQIVV
jgi:hypothetical protein